MILTCAGSIWGHPPSPMHIILRIILSEDQERIASWQEAEGMTEMSMRISLVMATIGRVDTIYRFLESIRHQPTETFELIFVDQNDDDRLIAVAAQARAYGMDVSHMRFSRKNLSAARNAGIREAKYGLIGFPDDDCWYENETLKGVLEQFAAPGVDGVVAKWVEEDLQGIESHDLSWNAMHRFKGMQPSSITIFLRRDLLLKVGEFDDLLGVPNWFGSGEETDLILRCLKAGGVIRYVPEVKVHHAFILSGAARDQDACSRIRTRARGAGALYAKHSMSPWVIFRGFISPVIRLVFPPYGVYASLGKLSMVWGRIEGYMQWHKQGRLRDSKANKKI